MDEHEIRLPNGSVIGSHSNHGLIDSTRSNHPWTFLTHGNVMRLPIDDPYFQRYSEWPSDGEVSGVSAEDLTRYIEGRLGRQKPE